MKISCIIIDDEPNALRLLKDYISKVKLLQLINAFHDGLDASLFLQKNNVDVIFTDIKMPLLSGLELAKILPGNQKFVFTTAYSQHALDSFNYNVIDYLLKPITFHRFNQTISKIEQASNGPNTNQPNSELDYMGKWLRILTGCKYR
jgi:two-component system LytT family response regulator